MADLVEKVKNYEKKLDDKRKSRKRDKYGEHVSKLRHYSEDNVRSDVSNDNYRENYEKIFGHK